MDDDEKKEVSLKFWKKRRYVVTILAFFGFFITYILRVNLSVAIVKMTEVQKIIDENGNIRYEREFEWDSKIHGLVLSSFYYGYIWTQVLGGWLAARIGGKQVFGIGIAATSFLTIITPPVTRYNFYLLIALRVLEGICEGVIYPSINAIWANWLPPLERSRLSSIAYSGSSIGTVFSMPVCGIMIDRFGWAIVFYTFGALGLIWYICWHMLVQNNPQDDPQISDSELKYIQHTLGCRESQKISHPWKAMLSSPALWAVIIVMVSDAWGNSTLITQLPTYMKDILNYNLQKTGILSALPYIMMSLSLQTSGHIADYLRKRNILTTTQVRKIFTSGASVAQALFMVGAAYVSSPNVAVICITLAGGFAGIAISGFCVNYLDIAPRHASVLWGIGNTIGTLPGILSPLVAGYIVQNKRADEWRTVFLISGGIAVFGAVIYGIWGNGEEQPWAKETKKNSEEPKICQDNPTLDVEKI